MGRRTLTAIGILALALTGGFGAGCGGEDEQTAEGEADAVVPFSEPERIKLAEGAITLIADEEEITAAGQEVLGRSYNGQLVGPTLVIEPGETFNLNIQNNLAETTNLHYHGFHVSPKRGSDEVVHLEIDPGDNFPYKVEVPEDHDQGTFWYHSHNHHSSEGQVFGGMSGVALIGTPKLPRGVSVAADRVLALKDFQVKDGEIPRKEINSGEQTTRTVNGLLEPRITAAPNSVELWHLANIGADIFYNVELTNLKLYVVAEDGNPSNLGPVQNLVLPPGKRFDVLVQFGQVGSYLLKTLPYSTGNGGDQYEEASLATVSVSGPAAKDQISLAREAQLAAEGVPQPTVEDPRVKRLTEDEDNEEFFINGKVFDPNRIDDEVKLGDVEDWLFLNETDEQHPIHMHQDDFWVFEENGKPVQSNGQRDTVIVPPRGSIRFRIQFNEFPGEFVYHCHILNHEDHGMMAVIKANPQGQGSRGVSATPRSHHDHSGHSH